MNKEHFVSLEDLKLILPIVVIIVSIIIWAITLQNKVDANEKAINSYPSSDWFNEKFKNVDNEFENINEKIDNLTAMIEEQKKN